ncbi:DNA recombination protein RmuC [Gleimia hominis]|uniref:DNA recombination protein RmuC n=1 Tax=Gleimia hominis TaxID=595468 RepID=UPI000C802197|nr:DNA recombination protein RmuC [Gleimia hominis]WIK63719.1 DNA recombination protein RmuC [Gleimia hominis]
METATWIIALICLLIGSAVGYALGRSRPHTDTTPTPPVDLGPLHDSIRTLGQHVQHMEVTQGQSMGTFGEQLRQTQNLNRMILEATSGLDSALRQSPKRGTWGEVSLRRVLEASGLTRHIDFEQQVSAGGKRPDVVVQLPAKSSLVIDAKVPLDAYLKAREDDEQSGTYMREHVRAVRRHVQELARRTYPQLVEGSVDSTIMFLPSEALVAASFDEDPTLFEQALSAGVIIAGPASLMILLRSVGSLWARQEVNDDAQALLELGNTLVDRLNVVTNHLVSLGDSIRAVTKHYNATIGSLEGRLLVTARSIRAVSDRVADTPPNVDEPLRQPKPQTDN